MRDTPPDARDRMSAGRRSSWEASCTAVEAYLDAHGGSSPPQEYRDEAGRGLGWWVTTQRQNHRNGTLDAARARRLEQIPGWSWGRPAAGSDDERLDAVAAFVAREGHSLVPARCIEGSVRIGSWVVAWRSQYRQGTLREDLRVALEDLDGWVWDPLQELWEEKFAAVVAWLTAGGDGLRLAGGVTSSDGLKIGVWADGQRRRFKQGKLAAGRVERLAALDGWHWNLRVARWRARFAEIDGAQGPQDESDRCWRRTQHRAYLAGTLEADHAGLLEGVGWWASTDPDPWYDHLAELHDWVERTGGVEFPRDPEIPLRYWATRQRKAKRKGTLDDDQIAALEAIKGWEWDKMHALWWSRRDELAAVVEQTGRLPTHAMKGDARLLLPWMAKQRRLRRAGTLRADRVAALEAIPGWWW